MAHTVVDPGTVMTHPQYTSPTKLAMMTPWWLIRFALLTVPYRAILLAKQLRSVRLFTEML